METGKRMIYKSESCTRKWDSYDAYLFDIDGTLLQCTDATHYFAFCNTLTALAGRPLNLDGVTAHGNVDVGILRDALTLAGVDENLWRPRIPEARTMLSQEVERNKANLCIEPTPCAAHLLHHLQNRGARLGVATGNLQTIGELKLSQCELLKYFDFACWSDDFERRKDVFAHALTLAQNTTRPDAAVCVVGDTPADIQAAQSNAMDVIAVATGIHDRTSLLQHKPIWCIDSFSDLFSPVS